MPITKSAAKRMHQSAVRRARNRSHKHEIRTRQASLYKLTADASAADRQQAFRLYSSALDRAAKKGIIHRNTASRLKSRAAARLASLGTAAAATPQSPISAQA